MTITKKPDTRPAPASWGLAASGRVPWEYASAPEATDHITIEPSYGLFIDNEFRPAKGRGTFEVINPATEEVLSRVARATPADVDRAVSAARRAHASVWSKLPGRERAKYLYRIARLLQERGPDVAIGQDAHLPPPLPFSL